jgi:predicted nucleic-acid-binding protein
VVAVDTNVVIRLLTRDHAAQAAQAVEIFRSGRVLIAKTVMLETAWVLRYSYEVGSDAILRALRALLGLPNVSVEDPIAVVRALHLLEQGIDFADALHIASSAPAERFVTFDRHLVKRSAGLAPIEVALP